MACDGLTFGDCSCDDPGGGGGPPPPPGGDGEWGHPDPHGRQKYEVVWDAGSVNDDAITIAKPYLLNLSNPAYNNSANWPIVPMPGVGGSPPSHPAGFPVKYEVTVQYFGNQSTQGAILLTGSFNGFQVNCDSNDNQTTTGVVTLDTGVIGVEVFGGFLVFGAIYNAFLIPVNGGAFDPEIRQFKFGVRITAIG